VPILKEVSLLASSVAMYIIVFVVSAAVLVFYLGAYWKIYEKAGLNGWAAIVPFYNLWTYCRAAGRPGWWMFLLLVPIVNIVVWCVIQLDLARSFARSVGFGVGLIFLSVVFVPVLGYGPAVHDDSFG
jgi:hypothetical protein